MFFCHKTCYFFGKVDYWFWVGQVVLEPIKPHVLPIFKRVNIHFWITFSVQILELKLITGELRYLEFQGNGENTSSFPKFEIANYDVTRIHVHEQTCVQFRL